MFNALEWSVVFVTSTRIEDLVLNCSFDGSAWTLANLYLASVGADLLGRDAPILVGFTEETTCYISADYFRDSDPSRTSSSTRAVTFSTIANGPRSASHKPGESNGCSKLPTQ